MAFLHCKAWLQTAQPDFTSAWVVFGESRLNVGRIILLKIHDHILFYLWQNKNSSEQKVIPIVSPAERFFTLCTNLLRQIHSPFATSGYLSIMYWVTCLNRHVKREKVLEWLSVLVENRNLWIGHMCSLLTSVRSFSSTSSWLISQISEWPDWWSKQHQGNCKDEEEPRSISSGRHWVLLGLH